MMTPETVKGGAHMCDDRSAAAEKILKTIEYGLLPVAEIEKRLIRSVDEALSGPIDAEYDPVTVEMCNSLLLRICSAGETGFEARAEENKARIMQRYGARQRRRKILLRALATAAAALALFAGLTALNLITPVQWYTGKSSDSGREYIVQGHQWEIGRAHV